MFLKFKDSTILLLLLFVILNVSIRPLCKIKIYEFKK